jgi:hypothetical protein
MNSPITVVIVNADHPKNLGMKCTSGSCDKDSVFVLRISLWSLEHSTNACERHALELKHITESNGLAT